MQKKFISLFIICIICIVPLIITPWLLDYYYHPKILVIYLLCFAFSVIYFTFLSSKDYPNSSIDTFVIIYLLLITASTIFSVNKVQSLGGRILREEGAFALFCYLFIFQLTSKFYCFSRYHVNLFFLSALVISLYGIMQSFGIDPVPVDSFRGSWNRYAYATIGNPNFLGSYLTLVLPLGIFFYLYTRKIKFLFLSSTLYLCLLCTRTRSAWIGFSFSFLALIILIIKNKLNPKYLILVIAVFVFITLSLNFYKSNEITNRASTILSDSKSVITNDSLKDRAGSTRFFIWRNAIKLIPIKPLLGYGPDTFDIAFMGNFREESKKYFGESIVDKAHNEYLQIAVTTGLPSLAVYLLIPFTLLYYSLKKIKKNTLIIPLFCSILGYLVQGFFNISVVSVAPIFWIFMGILNSFTECP